jgi:hypothetical protein
MQRAARDGVNKFLGYKVELRGVSFNGGFRDIFFAAAISVRKFV